MTGLDPRFPSFPNTGFGSPVTADTSYTSPSNAVTCWTAGLKNTDATGIYGGGQIKRITIRALADLAAVCICRLFIHDGSNYHLFDEIELPVTDGGTNDEQASADVFYDDVFLEDGWTLRATTTTGDDLKVIVFGLDF